ncbi:hypothetical protein BX283_1732 [Streptomyces sp. TLI_146]|nr:hypothetical protein BX283_1732 [Streptomyces sp. TLI_146]
MARPQHPPSPNSRLRFRVLSLPENRDTARRPGEDGAS